LLGVVQQCRGVGGFELELEVRERFQTYDALLRLRHDADCNDRSVTLMETCKAT
jgi:hypothetical protein